jgi:hypothetical protein
VWGVERPRGTGAELPVGPEAAAGLHFENTHCKNMEYHVNTKKAHQDRADDPRLDPAVHPQIIDDYIDKVLRSGHSRIVGNAAAHAGSEEQADPFAGLTPAERAMWPEKCHLFYLEDVFIRRPIDIRMCGEVVEAMNRSQVARAGSASGSVLQAAAPPVSFAGAAADVDAVDDTLLQVTSTPVGGGSARTDGGAAVSGPSSSGPPPQQNPGAGPPRKQATLRNFGNGVPQFSMGHTSSFSITTIPAAFGAVYAREVARKARAARFFSIAVDEVVQNKEKVLTVYVTLVPQGKACRETFFAGTRRSAASLFPEAALAEMVGGVAHVPVARSKRTPPDSEPAAKRMCEDIINVLKLDLGLTEDEIARRLVGVHVDGASVNTGEHNGLVQRLAERVGHPLHTVHCVAHRTSLIGLLFSLCGPGVRVIEQIPDADKGVVEFLHDVSALVTSATVAAHVPIVARVLRSIFKEDGRLGEYRMLPTICVTRYLTIAEPLDALLRQWGPLYSAAVAKDDKAEAAPGFLRWGKDVGLLLLTCMLSPALRGLQGLCKHGQSASAHYGSVVAQVARLRAQLERQYGLCGDADRTAFGGPAFERLRHFTRLYIDQGALVEHGGHLDLYVGASRLPIELRRFKGWGGSPQGSLVSMSELPAVVELAKEAAQKVVRLIIAQLEQRFPADDPVARALAIGDVSYWHDLVERGSYEHLVLAAQTIERSFLQADGTPLFRCALMVAQAPAFHAKVLAYATTQSVSPDQAPSSSGVVDNDDDDVNPSEAFAAAAARAVAAGPRSPSDELWRTIFDMPSAWEACSEWLHWVNPTYALLLGTNDNERAHSRFKLLRTALRNNLSLERLTDALRVTLHPTKIDPKVVYGYWAVGRRNSTGKRARE